MIKIPKIQIHQQYAKLGMDADKASMEQRQPAATMDLSTTKPQLQMKSPSGELKIDQSRAWDALGCGGILEAMNRIYDQADSLFLQSLQRMVERGNRLAEIHTGVNAIAENASELFLTYPQFNYYGPASPDNVDIHYTARKPQIEVERGQVNLDVQMNRPELIFQRGKLDIYMLQHGKVEFTPPQIDLRI